MATMIPFIVIAVVLIFLSGIRIIRPTERGLIERLGKYSVFAIRDFTGFFRASKSCIRVNITEQMVDADPQEIITNDNLNASVDAQVYFKVKSDELV